MADVTQLLLENKQAPGDLLMMTCLVRDLHLQYPGRYKTYVSSTVPDIWKNNPLITKLDNSKSHKYLKMGYSVSIKNADRRYGHFATGFLQDFTDKTGIKVRLTDMRPDVYLTDEEKAQRPIEEPYWVMMAGGKQDFTAKHWDSMYWQQTVDMLEGHTKFVQVGHATHIHKPLKRVINKIGKTQFRDLMVLVYHSEGVVCPMTCGSHLAAAFNKPCVVVAGGRESWWWEHYSTETWAANSLNPCPEDFINQTFLHTIGQLPCCTKDGCWKSGIGEKKQGNNCKRVVAGPTQRQPQCMTMIKPKMVAEAIRLYADGGQPEAQAIPEHLRPPLFTLKPGETSKKELADSRRLPRRQYGSRRRGEARHGLEAMRAAAEAKQAQNIVLDLSGPLEIRQDVVKTKVLDKVTICVLLYGDFPDLAKRCLGSLYRMLHPSHFELRLGLNAVCDETRKWIEENVLPVGNVILYDHPENAFKYPVMREMFWGEHPLETEWVMWFDDDSYVNGIKWYEKLDSFLHTYKKVDMVGKLYFFPMSQGNAKWVKKAEWYKGKAFKVFKDKPKADFMTGGWWTVRRKVIEETNWPDTRLSHNGGDWSFGEACHQGGFSIKQFHYGVKISDYKRRGASQKHPTA